jgi:hypothetical protein
MAHARPALRRARLVTLHAALLALLSAAVACEPRAAPRSTRKDELRAVVDDSAGHAHLTRGMNGHTIDALDRAARPDDLPALKELLFDADGVVAMTAANVLARRGEPGQVALREALVLAQQRGLSHAEGLIREHVGQH